jgi:phosphoribosylanthranilate isomerase
VHNLFRPVHAPGGATAALFSQAAQPFVKICGLTDLTHAIAVSQLHADAFGLMFAPSRRRVTLERAIEITCAVRQSSKGTAPLAVGVFINEDAASITDIAHRVGLQAIQLSGDESPGFCSEVVARTALPVIKAVRMRKADDMAILDAYALAGATLLFDTLAVGSYGGTGQVGDWMLAREAAARWPIILAGGLSPANVGSALAIVAPRGVDVSSGVETNGAKDPQKIQMFIAAARSYVPTRCATSC